MKVSGLLILSNLFMTYAWYGHLRTGTDKPLFWVILMSWGVAFFEYMIMVPANRIGYAGGLELGQLKVMQEVITLLVFVPFSLLLMDEKWRWDYLWAFFCIVGAVFFVFRNKW
ncbi:MAG: DMT family protein [Opitutales bacterium]|nr:DMT family protein [Opitutales bacterium]